MKRKIEITINFIISIVCFIISGIFFNDISFPFLGLGIIFLGVTLASIINRNN